MFSIVIIGIGILYRYGPNVKTPRTRIFTWGALVAALVAQAQAQGARQHGLRSLIGHLGGLTTLGRRCELLGVDEGQRDLAVEVDVLGPPELQTAGAAVLLEQSVPAAGDRSAGDEARSAAAGARCGVGGAGRTGIGGSRSRWGGCRG